MAGQDVGCRLHIKAWQEGKAGAGPDGAFNFYDVGLRELKKLRAKYDKITIVTFGKWVADAFAQERARAEAIVAEAT
jgi:hypothetical protein